MATHFVSARLRGKGRLSASEEHRDLHRRPVAPTPRAQHQRESALERHVARWQAVVDARARGLLRHECWRAAAEALASSSARGKPETVKKSYKRVQRQYRKQGRLLPK
jgi:plasmid stabilization system protein ParE